MIKLRINPLPSTTYHLPTTNRGFTIIELVIVITIMAILLTLGVVNLRGSQANGRDAERKVDIETIAQHLETVYSGGTDASLTNTDCTGGDISHDGLYTVHKFTTVGNNNLTCTISTTAEVLVVGGGGGGSLGGGGAGGYLSGAETLSGTISVAVGSGGAGGLTRTGNGTNGGDSIFGTTRTARGGGGGGGTVSDAPLIGSAGASGGGGSHSGSAGGAATPAGQGHAGGTDQGGGGGAAASGGNGNTNVYGGIGGAGFNNDIILRGVNVGYAGGGGGGVWVSGLIGGTATHGGGAGKPNSTTGNDGTANTGGGGGGVGYGWYAGCLGGSGGSGIVIVRYLTPIGIGTYPSTLFLGTLTSIKLALRDIDPDSLIAPGLAVVGDDDTATAAHVASTFIAATNNSQTTAGVLPQPTTSQYVYQPLQTTDGGTTWSLCTTTTQECRKFNLYYRSEVDNSVNMVTSVNQ